MIKCWEFISNFFSDNKGMRTDIELIRNIKNGNDDDFNELLENYHNLIYKIINIYNLSVGDYYIDSDDLYQEASLALYKAVHNFDENRGASFTTYAYIVIKNRITSMVKKYKLDYQRYSLSLDAKDYSDYATLVSDNTIAYHKEREFREYLSDFVLNLNDEDKQIVSLYHKDYTYKEIAERLNTSTKRVDNRLCTLRKRIKDIDL